MIDINKKVKYAINVLFIAVVGYLTFRILFANREISDVLKELHRADKVWLAFGALAVFCFIAGESVIIKYMLEILVSSIQYGLILLIFLASSWLQWPFFCHFKVLSS